MRNVETTKADGRMTKAGSDLSPKGAGKGGSRYTPWP
jgi:hypothetical protein